MDSEKRAPGWQVRGEPGLPAEATERPQATSRPREPTKEKTMNKIASAADKPKMEVARKRADIILKVRSGQMNAVQAARELGVSRKTYYKWEKRGLQSMIMELTARKSGRPRSEVGEETEALKKKVKDLEKKLKRTQGLPTIQEMLKMNSANKKP